MEFDKQPQSEFNAAIAFLNMINTSFIIAADCMFQSNIEGWVDSLLNIFIALTNYIGKEKDVKFKEIKALKNEVNKIVINKNKGLRKGTDPALYWKLVEFEMWLREVYGKSGLENRMMDDAMKALK